MASQKWDSSRFASFSIEKISSCYDQVIKSLKAQKYSYNSLDELNKIFLFNLSNLDFFPKIRLNANSNGESSLFSYFECWAKKFLESQLPSKRKIHESDAPSDWIVYNLINLVVDEHQNSQSKNPSIHDIERFHKMAMQSENIIGDLLEEFIASKLSKFGWIWCKGEVVRAVDFIKPGNDPKDYILLQVKNKYNTENSSSSAIREGTKIKKWFRLKRQKDIHGYAESNWADLVSLVSNGPEEKEFLKDDLSETNFRIFISNVVKNNHNLIWYIG